MKHKGSIICLAILGILILAIIVGLGAGNSSPMQTIGFIVILGVLVLLFIIILIILIIKAI